jgi:hypothetical protein
MSMTENAKRFGFYSETQVALGARCGWWLGADGEPKLCTEVGASSNFSDAQKCGEVFEWIGHKLYSGELSLARYKHRDRISTKKGKS